MQGKRKKKKKKSKQKSKMQQEMESSKETKIEMYQTNESMMSAQDLIVKPEAAVIQAEQDVMME